MDDAEPGIAADHRGQGAQLGHDLAAAVAHQHRLAGAEGGEVQLRHPCVQLQPAVADEAEGLLARDGHRAGQDAAAGDGAVGRGQDAGLAEPRRGLVAPGAGGEQPGLGLQRGGLALFQNLPGDAFAAGQLGGAAEVGLGDGQRRLGLPHRRLGLGGLGRGQGIVQPRQQLAAADAVALLDRDLEDPEAAGLDAHHQLLPGDDRAVAEDRPGERLGGDRGQRDGQGGRGRLWAGRRRRKDGPGGPQQPGGGAGGQQQDQQDRPAPTDPPPRHGRCGRCQGRLGGETVVRHRAIPGATCMSPVAADHGASRSVPHLPLSSRRSMPAAGGAAGRGRIVTV